MEYQVPGRQRSEKDERTGSGEDFVKKLNLE